MSTTTPTNGLDPTRGWLHDAPRGRWPLTPKVVTDRIHYPAAIVDEVLAEQTSLINSHLRSEGLFVSGPVILALDHHDPLVTFLADTHYLNEDAPFIPSATEDAECLRLLGSNRYAVTHDYLVEELVEITGVDVQTVDDIVGTYWDLYREAWMAGFDEPGFIPRLALERDIEDWLVASLDVLDEHGYDLELLADDAGRPIGRQYRLPNRQVCDLVCRSRTDNSIVVIELKAGSATLGAVTQLTGYLEAVRLDLNLPGR